MLPNPMVVSFVPSKIKEPSEIEGEVQVFATEESGVEINNEVIGGPFSQQLVHGVASFALQVFKPH